MRGNEIQKVSSPDPYGRIGNQAGAAESRSCSATTRPTRTPSSNARIVSPSPILGPEPCASWTSRPATTPVDRARPQRAGGDPRYGRRTARLRARVGHPGDGEHPGHAAWSEPDEWQSPMPNLFIQGDRAYVSDPATKTLYAVDLSPAKVANKATLPAQTIELTGVTG